LLCSCITEYPARSPFLEGDAAIKTGESGAPVLPLGDCGGVRKGEEGVEDEATGSDAVFRMLPDGEGGGKEVEEEEVR
jgi:hypothetical protein